MTTNNTNTNNNVSNNGIKEFFNLDEIQTILKKDNKKSLLKTLNENDKKKRL